jgi:hypothetical protein
MDWQHLLAYISGSVAQKLLLCNEYLVAKNPSCATKFRSVSG